MARPYHHAQFPPGVKVYIDPAIRNIHALSPVAGQIAQTCEGMIYENLVAFEDQAKLVPIQWQGLKLYIEEAYVSLAHEP